MTTAAATKPRDSKRFLTGVVVVFSLILFLITTSNTPEKTAISYLISATDSEHVVATGSGMKLTEYTENGTRFYALEAQDWTQYQKEQHHYVTFQAPAVELFATNTTQSWRVSAQHGRLAQQGRKPSLELLDNVVLEQGLINANQLRLRSDQLTVDTANEMITARGSVELNAGPMQTQAPVMVMRNNEVLEFSGIEEQRVVSNIRLMTTNANDIPTAINSDDA